MARLSEDPQTCIWGYREEVSPRLCLPVPPDWYLGLSRRSLSETLSSGAPRLSSGVIDGASLRGPPDLHLGLSRRSLSETLSSEGPQTGIWGYRKHVSPRLYCIMLSLSLSLSFGFNFFNFLTSLTTYFLSFSNYLVVISRSSSGMRFGVIVVRIVASAAGSCILAGRYHGSRRCVCTCDRVVAGWC